MLASTRFALNIWSVIDLASSQSPSDAVNHSGAVQYMSKFDRPDAWVKQIHV